jgi:hypothetical protein
MYKIPMYLAVYFFTFFVKKCEKNIKKGQKTKFLPFFRLF